MQVQIEETSGAQYLQLDSVHGGVTSGSPHESAASSPGSPRRVAFTHLNSITPSEHHGNVESPQLTQLSSHISYTGGVDSPPAGNING